MEKWEILSGGLYVYLGGIYKLLITTSRDSKDESGDSEMYSRLGLWILRLESH